MFMKLQMTKNDTNAFSSVGSFNLGCILHWNFNWDLTIQYGKDEGRHAQALQAINSRPESAGLTHEDTITIKDLDDAYAAATDELIAELDKATAEWALRLCSY